MRQTGSFCRSPSRIFFSERATYQYGYCPRKIHWWTTAYCRFNLLAVSALSLSLLTVDRYVFITRYSILMTTKMAVLLIVAVWLASFVPHLLLYLISSKSDPTGSLRAFQFFDLVVYEISPMLALPFLAGRIFVIVRRQERRLEIQMRQVRFNRRAEPGSEMSSHNRRTATLKFICAAVAVFGFCYLCETILTAYQLITGPGKRGIRRIYWHVLTLLYIANSAINPVVYALFKTDIKRSLRRMVHHNCRRYWSGLHWTLDCAAIIILFLQRALDNSHRLVTYTQVPQESLSLNMFNKLRSAKALLSLTLVCLRMRGGDLHSQPSLHPSLWWFYDELFEAGDWTWNLLITVWHLLATN